MSSPPSKGRRFPTAWVFGGRIAQIGPFAPLVAGAGASLYVNEFFQATPLSKWVALGAFLILGTLSGKWLRLRAWPSGFVAAVAFLAIFAALIPLAATAFAHWHELPGWTGAPAVWLLKALGYDAAVTTEWLVHTLGEQEWVDPHWRLVVTVDGLAHRASLTFEKWLPFSLLALVLWTSIAASTKTTIKGRCVSLLAGLGMVAAYLPVRLVIALLTAWEFDWLGAYWNTWINLLSFAPLALALGCWQRWDPWGGREPTAQPPPPPGIKVPAGAAQPVMPPAGRTLPKLGLAAGALACLSMAAVVFGFFWHPPGKVKGGRVLMDDAHSNWEWSDIAFDTNDYTQKASYNYYCFCNFLRTYYDVQINKDQPITAELLRDVDVLILKTPTEPYSPEEIDAVEEWVRYGGGGLCMLGDHTNLFGMSTYMNAVASRFGIEFVHDDTYDLLTGMPTFFRGGIGWTHPIVAPMDFFEFETSCTLRCPLGAEAMVGYAMGAEYVDYGHVNFFGDIAPQPDETWGGFVQMSAVDADRGRVAAFSDSTVYSNFSMFFDDKPLLGLRTIDWLSRGGGWLTTPRRQAMLEAAGIVLLLSLIAMVAAGALDRPWRLVVLALVVAGSTFGLNQWSKQRQANPGPRPDAALPPYVDFLGSMSMGSMPSMLDLGNFDDPLAFDTLFVNLQRLGIEPYVDNPLKLQRPPAFKMVVNPIYLVESESTGPFGHDHAEHGAGEEKIINKDAMTDLAKWVHDGGTLLVIGQTGERYGFALNDLMEACGVVVDWKTVSVEMCWDHGGAHDHQRLADQPNGTVFPMGAYIDGDIVDVAHGKGRAVFLTNSRLFSRKGIGAAFKAPTPSELVLYKVEYSVVRSLLDREELDRAEIQGLLEEFAGLRQEEDSKKTESAAPREPH